jgi:hypothetical protein
MTLEFSNLKIRPELIRNKYKKPIEKQNPNGTGPARPERVPENLKKHIKRVIST